MARENWPLIRLLLSDLSVTYEEVMKMDVDEVYMLNAALDIHHEMMEKEKMKNVPKQRL